jgi:hypothetical protein
MASDWMMDDKPLIGRYRKVYPKLWSDARFLALPQSDRLVLLYLLSGPQSNRIGLFKVSLGSASEDLKTSSVTFRKRLLNVCATFGWEFDDYARVLWIPSWWRFNPPENENVLKGNLKDLGEVPASLLVGKFCRNLETLDERFTKTFLERVAHRIHEHSTIQDQDQKPDHEPDQDHGRVHNHHQNEDQKQNLDPEPKQDEEEE